MSWNELLDACKTEKNNWENLQRLLMLQIILFEEMEPKLSDQIKQISNVEMKSDAKILLKSLKQFQGSVKPMKKNKKSNIQADMKKSVRCETVKFDEMTFCFAKQQEFWKAACDMEQNVDWFCNFSNDEIHKLETLLETNTSILDSFRAKFEMSKRSRNLLKTTGKLLGSNILQLRKARLHFREIAERIIGSSADSKIYDLQEKYSECVVRLEIAASTLNEQGIFQAIKVCQRFLIEIPDLSLSSVWCLNNHVSVIDQVKVSV
jgi:isocitrate dehydrogenase kinase/phosphatase